MVGKNIKKHRELKNMTQEELAQRLNITRQAISNWENDKTQPDIDTLHKISELLDISIEELIYGTPRTFTNVTNQTVQKNITKGVSFGMVLAMVISYVKWQSIGWAIFHGLLNWFYIIYYIFKYGWS